ncbi:MAG: cytochrome-c peroxidase [Sedimenticola sp.]
MVTSSKFKAVFWLLLLIPAVATVSAASVYDEPIRPIPREHGQDLRKVSLGDMLFHDVRLSRDDSISCAHCHKLARGGTDGLSRSIGVSGAVGNIKAPTVYNSRFNLAQFWDGRAANLHEQAGGPVNNPIEMASNWEQVISKLKRDQDYTRRFNELYADGITEQNIRDAITSFEHTLITVDSPFDRWLRGDANALGERELEGYELFKSYGCISCHQGVNVGGNMFQRMGALGDYFSERGMAITEADRGRFNVTGRDDDLYFFKVPSLRLAAINSPYFHDGSVQDLDEAVRVMGLYQLGRKIPEQHVALIIDFLQSLVGNHPDLQP